MVDGDPGLPAWVGPITRVILGPEPPKRGNSRACWDLECQRTATASSSRKSSVPRHASVFVGMTLSAHDDRTEITGGPPVGSSHLHGLLKGIAGLGLARTASPA